MATTDLDKRRGLRDAPTSVKRVHVLDHGTLSLDRSIMIYGPTLASINDPERAAEWLTIPSYSVLIECDEHRILFDTGSHPHSAERWPEALKPLEVLTATEECFLPNRLEQLGLRPSDVDIVVASHLHMDHSGCLEYFGDARIVVHRDELRSALEHYARVDGSPAYVKDDVAAWIRAQLKWSIVDRHDPDFTLVPGVRVLNFGPGHVEGLLALLVELPGYGELLLASDVCYAQPNLGPPPILPGTASVYDSVGMVQSARRLTRTAEELGAEIWFGHDPEQYRRLRKAPDGFYE
jgi:N-acyl homoserine lactone hydrolase